MQIQVSWLLQKPTDLDLVCKGRVYPGSARQGLIVNSHLGRLLCQLTCCSVEEEEEKGTAIIKALRVLMGEVVSNSIDL